MLVGGPEGEATGALAAFAALGLPLAQIVRTFLATLADEKFVVPICTSMGYAHVLRETGCDKHLVELLVKPLRHFRPLVLPGIVLVGFVVNVPLISQASTAVASGIVLVPLARAAGIAPITIGAALALGCSIGGELLNPGSPELRSIVETLHDTTPNLTSEGCLAPIRSLIGWHLALATGLFWLLVLLAAAGRQAHAGVGRACDRRANARPRQPGQGGGPVPAAGAALADQRPAAAVSGAHGVAGGRSGQQGRIPGV